jgi:glycerophosphoryl diester phosphodiesterase
MSLAALRALRPDWPLALNAVTAPADWRDSLRALSCVSFHLQADKVTPGLVAQVHDAGFQCAVYTVNDAAAARALVGWGVDSIITDRPAEIGAALGEAAG